MSSRKRPRESDDDGELDTELKRMTTAYAARRRAMGCASGGAAAAASPRQLPIGRRSRGLAWAGGASAGPAPAAVSSAASAAAAPALRRRASGSAAGSAVDLTVDLTADVSPVQAPVQRQERSEVSLLSSSDDDDDNREIRLPPNRHGLGRRLPAWMGPGAPARSPSSLAVRSPRLAARAQRVPASGAAAAASALGDGWLGTCWAQATPERTL